MAVDHSGTVFCSWSKSATMHENGDLECSGATLGEKQCCYAELAISGRD
jgi:hypothetical protein